MPTQRRSRKLAATKKARANLRSPRGFRSRSQLVAVSGHEFVGARLFCSRARRAIRGSLPARPPCSHARDPTTRRGVVVLPLLPRRGRAIGRRRADGQAAVGLWADRGLGPLPTPRTAPLGHDLLITVSRNRAEPNYAMRNHCEPNQTTPWDLKTEPNRRAPTDISKPRYITLQLSSVAEGQTEAN